MIWFVFLFCLLFRWGILHRVLWWLGDAGSCIQVVSCVWVLTIWYSLGLVGGSDDKASACNAGDPGSIPGLGRSPGEGNGNPLQRSCLKKKWGVWTRYSKISTTTPWNHCVCLVARSCPTLCNPMDWSPPGFSVHGDSPGKNTGVGCHFLLQEIFPTQGLNPGLPHCRQMFYRLSHQ